MKSKRITILVLMTALVMSLFSLPAVYAGAPTITLKTVSETTGGLAVGEDASIKLVMEWDEFVANATVTFKVYNSTDKLVATLGSAYEIPVKSITPDALFTDTNRGEEGRYDTTFSSVADLADDVGTHTYTLKVADSTSGIVYDEKDFVVNVADEHLTLAVTWEDTNEDRRVEVGESIVSTVHVDWVFMEETETYTVWTTVDNEAPLQRKAISVTAGSGSDTATFTEGWNTDGDKTIKIELKDSAGVVVKSLSVPIKVGGNVAQDNTASTADTASPTGAAALFAMITGNIYLSGEGVIPTPVLHPGQRITSNS